MGGNRKEERKWVGRRRESGRKGKRGEKRKAEGTLGGEIEEMGEIGGKNRRSKMNPREHHKNKIPPN